MFEALLRFFTGKGKETDGKPAPNKEFQLLNKLAPIKDTVEGATTEAKPTGGDSSAEAAHSVVCREAVLNREQRVAGYEFTLRKSMRQRIRHSGAAILRLYDDVLVKNLVGMQIERLLGERLAFVAVAASSLSLPSVEALPRKGAVLLIRSIRDLGDKAPETVARAVQLRGLGYRIALDDFVDAPEFEAFLPVADFVTIDTSAEDVAQIGRSVSVVRARFANKQLVAKNIESVDDFEICRKLPFHFFQGAFVTRREKWDQPAQDPSRMKLCSLLNEIRKKAESPKIAAGFKQDPVLSYKLLRYINSPAAGLQKKVTSIEQALVLLGRQKLYRWLTLLMFSVGEAHERDLALMENALVRARLTEMLGQGKFSPAQLDELFVVGIFSLIDVLFRAPMAEILAQLNLPPAVAEALASMQGPYAPYLELAIACEEFDQDKITRLAASCGLDVGKVNSCHIEALIWAQEAEK